ncbi:ABC-type Fe3+/spermidine/putrescine transport system ATPase subunit [Desulfohalotomaculum tongense]|uniref:ABC transporter ATP-binding protein n=1 Tax=Desulforadius tongensis TaxID=1216062 RepID=UPI00195DEC74|nr:ABC transporter ATP-binding protein [Desulforadius tongensis]MBM7853936.1 ABC-type Fe3+/spermidine/putrescine transport system ATPase subunit [Desulforadius tongensis]
MIEVRNLSLTLPEFALDDVSLSIDTGEFFALLGPTGSGKTLLLEAIAGLKDIHRGKIIINGKDVTKLKPEQRNISIVYQDYALFPNMTVKDNINYGLRFKKNVRGAGSRFDLLVEMLGISRLLNRYPHNLSGGEQQRVALARALIVEPDILLLDEPFSALDANTKETVQKEIKKIHSALKTTTLMVTHNFSEVFSLAGKVAIIHRGIIQQVGSIEEVFKTPNSKFTARFVGMKNIFPLKQMNGKFNFKDLLEQNKHHHNGGSQYYVGLRAEDIVVGNERLETDYQLKGIITAVSNNGIYSEVKVHTDSADFTAYLTPNRYFELELAENKPVFLGFNKKDINLIRE